MAEIVILKRLHDVRGTLSVAEFSDWPYPIRRVFWLYDIPGGASQRAGHAHRTCRELIVPVMGSFDVHANGEVFRLSKPWLALDVPPLTWTELRDFSGGAACLVLCSEPYDPADYIRECSELPQK